MLGATAGRTWINWECSRSFSIFWAPWHYISQTNTSEDPQHRFSWKRDQSPRSVLENLQIHPNGSIFSIAPWDCRLWGSWAPRRNKLTRRCKDERGREENCRYCRRSCSPRLDRYCFLRFGSCRRHRSIAQSRSIRRTASNYPRTHHEKCNGPADLLPSLWMQLRTRFCTSSPALQDGLWTSCLNLQHIVQRFLTPKLCDFVSDLSDLITDTG